MESVNEINLSISEFQDVNELNAEELEAVAGGGLAAGFLGALAGYGFSRLSGASVAESIQAGAAAGGFGLLIPEP